MTVFKWNAWPESPLGITMWFLWLQVMAQTTEPRGCPARPVLHSQAAAFSNQQTLLEFICPSALWELTISWASVVQTLAFCHGSTPSSAESFAINYGISEKRNPGCATEGWNWQNFCLSLWGKLGLKVTDKGVATRYLYRNVTFFSAFGRLAWLI